MVWCGGGGGGGGVVFSDYNTNLVNARLDQTRLGRGNTLHNFAPKPLESAQSARLYRRRILEKFDFGGTFKEVRDERI